MDRFCWPFDTPNQAALEYSLLGVLSGYSSIYALRFGAMRGTLLVSFLAMVSIASVSCLLATQSRAGLASYAIAWGCVFFQKAEVRKYALLPILLLLCSIPFFPAVLARFGMTSDELANGDRPQLWNSMGWIISDYPLTGLGDRFVPILNHWYIPKNLFERFYTGLNDYLTIAAVFGLPCLFLYFSVVAMALLLGWKHRNFGITPAVTAGIILISVCGLFQAHLWTGYPLYSLLALMCALMVIDRVQSSDSRCSWKDIKVHGKIAVGVGAFMTLAMAVGISLMPTQRYWKMTSDQALTVIDPSKSSASQNSYKVLFILDVLGRKYCDAIKEEMVRHGFACTIIIDNRVDPLAHFIPSGPYNGVVLVGDHSPVPTPEFITFSAPDSVDELGNS